MTLDFFKLDGDVAIVTGGGRGLGRAMALGLAEAGADVVVASRNLENLKSVCRDMEALGQRALAVQTDVAHPEQLENLVDQTLSALGKIDILVNNAGTTYRMKAEDYPVEQWDRVMNVNLRAMFSLCQLVGRQMIKQDGGCIINVASLMSVMALSSIPAYVASKSGVAGLTRALAVEWAKHNIRVNAIAPGYFKTDLTAGLEDDPERGPMIALRIPMKRWGQPDELKGAVVFLASQASAYVTGQVLYVDGGWLAG